MRVAILLFDGVEEMDFVGPLEVFAVARKLGADIDIVSVSPAPVITCAHGLNLTDLSPLADWTTCDLLVVPGGGWLANEDTGVRAAMKDPKILAGIRDARDRGAVIASVCTGAFLLAEAGILHNVPAATHHRAAQDLRGYGIRVVDARIVDCGQIVTAGGVTSGLDLSIHLVERLFGEKLARMVETYLEYERRGPVRRI